MLKEYVASGKTMDAAIDKACEMANVTVDMADIEVLDVGSKGLFGIGHRDAKVKLTVEVPDEPVAKPAPTTFGQKKTKREKFEQKKAKPEFEFRPIVTADDLSKEEILQQEKKADKPRQPKPERSKPERSNREKGDRKRPNRETLEHTEKAAPEKVRASRTHEVKEGEMADRLRDEAMAFLTPIFATLKIEPILTASVQEGILWLSFSGENLGLLIGRRGETLNSLQYLTNLVVNKRRHDHVRIVLNVEGYRESREETLAALARKMAEKAVRTGRRVELEPMNPHERRLVHIALQDDKRVETLSHGEEPYRRVVISKKRSGKNRRRGGKNRKGNPAEAAAVNAPQDQAPAVEAPAMEAPAAE